MFSFFCELIAQYVSRQMLTSAKTAWPVVMSTQRAPTRRVASSVRASQVSTATGQHASKVMDD